MTESGAPVGESQADYGAWARSWARVRRMSYVRLFLVVGVVVASIVCGVVGAPWLSLRLRHSAIAAAADDLDMCCKRMNRGWGSSCYGKLAKEAETLSLDAGVAVAAITQTLAPVLPGLVAPEVEARAAARRNLWLSCAELAALEDGAPDLRGAAFHDVVAAARNSDEHAIAVAAEALAERAGPRP